MTDVVSTETRSRMMSGIRGKDTNPELLIRRGLHRQGLRFRLHVKELPGKPDMVLPRHNVVVFVHGCFWHAHGCRLFKWPKSREQFWRGKLGGNKKRDRKHVRELLALGWRVAVVWECDLKGQTDSARTKTIRKLSSWIRSGRGKCWENTQTS